MIDLIERIEFKAETERVLYKRWPMAIDLREEFPYMGDLIKGQFAGVGSLEPKFNVYLNWAVVSRNLVHSTDRSKKYPTVGIIIPGEYRFPTGDNTEILTVLDGELEASVTGDVSKMGPTSTLRRDGTIVAPAGTTLNLRVKNNRPGFYICRYIPKS